MTRERRFAIAALFQLAGLLALVVPQLRLLSAPDQLLLDASPLPGEPAGGRVTLSYRIGALPRARMQGTAPHPGDAVYVLFKRAADGFDEVSAWGTEKPNATFLAGTLQSVGPAGATATYGLESVYLKDEQLADFEFASFRAPAAGKRGAVRVKLRVASGQAAVEDIRIEPEPDDAPAVRGAAHAVKSAPMKRIRLQPVGNEAAADYYSLNDSHEAVLVNSAHPEESRRLADNVVDLLETGASRQRLLLRFPLPVVSAPELVTARLYLRYEENTHPGQSTLEVWGIRRAFGVATITDWQGPGRQTGAPSWACAYYPEVRWTQPGLGAGDLDREPLLTQRLTESAGLVAVDLTAAYKRELARPGSWNGVLIRLSGPESQIRLWWRGSPWDGSPGTVLEIRMK
jgi:hypothetical protein